MSGGEDSKINLSDEYDEEELELDEIEEYRSRHKDKEIHEWEKDLPAIRYAYDTLSALWIEMPISGVIIYGFSLNGT